jgi:DNA-binding IclR family transcriptional regulator
MDSRENKSSPYKVQVLDRALGILDYIGDAPSGLTLIEITQRLELHKSTVHRLLMILEQNRLVTRKGNKYFLGLKLFILGNKVANTLDVRKCAPAYLEQLVSETGETAHLCMLDDGKVLYLEKVEASRTVRVPSNVGGRYPIHCGGAGKALLAFLSTEELDLMLKGCSFEAFTPNTATTPERLKRELELVRQRGFSIDNEEFEEGLKCIGAPVRDHTDNVIAAISIAGPSSRITDGKIQELAGSVVKAANNLSHELGYGGKIELERSNFRSRLESAYR